MSVMHDTYTVSKNNQLPQHIAIDHPRHKIKRKDMATIKTLPYSCDQSIKYTLESRCF